MKPKTLAYVALAVVGVAMLANRASAAKSKQADSDAYGLPSQPGYQTLAAPMNYLDKAALESAIATNLAKLQTTTPAQTQPTQTIIQTGGGSNSAANAAAAASIVSSIAKFFS